MNEFVSTYQKDFNWPYVKTFPIRTERQPYQTPIKSHCICGSEPGGTMPPKEYVGPIEGDTYQWSRLGPMAPLLDPKLYPAKVGPAPEFEITRHDQPNTYLKKLQERYPYLYDVLQSAPPDELIRRVNEDRLRTTYQMDYSHMEEHPSADYEKLLARAGVSVCSKMRSSPRENLPILDCRSKLRPPEYDAPIQPTSMTIEILARSDAGGFPMGLRDKENEYRDFEYDPRDAENDYRDPRDHHTGMESVEHRSGNDYDEPGDRTFRSRNVPDRHDHRDPNKNSAKRFENVQDRPRNDPRDRGGNAKGKNTAGGVREAATRGNGFKGDQTSGANAVRGRGNRTDDHGGRGEEGAARGVSRPADAGAARGGSRPADAGAVRGGSRPTDGRDARPTDTGGGNAGPAVHEGGGGGRGDGRVNESGGGRGDARVNETGGGGRGNDEGGGGGGGGRPPRKSVIGFGVGEEGEPKSKKAHRAKEDEEASKKPLPPWKSEYQEVIGQTGMHIIKDKMHQHGGRSSGRKLMERIIMKCPT